MISSKRILILEDEIVVGMDLSELLGAHGYEVEVRHHYADAMACMKQFEPQLVITDINLGEVNSGIDFAKEAGKIDPQVEIIYLTAYSSSSILASAEETSPFNFIVKPWNDQQILVTVQMAFNFIHQKSLPENLLQDLSLAEYRVLELVAQQKTSKEIAQALFISEKTVRNHRYNISKKLNLSGDKNSLLKWAIKYLQ